MKKFSFFVLMLIAWFGYAVFATPAIEYSTTAPTSGDVIATLTWLETGDVITNNSWLPTYTFTANGTFTFEYSWATATGSAIATVANIDKTAPTWTMTYSPSTSTTGNVTGTISFTEVNVTITNNSWLATYTFTGNTSFTFTFHDVVGNTWSTSAAVTWITGAISTWTTGTGTTNTGSVSTWWLSTWWLSTATSNTGTQETIQQTIQQTGTLTTDSCPLGDKSWNTTDGKCYATRTWNITKSKYSTETNDAYLFAYSKGVTDAATIQKATVDGRITRKQFAKMAALFAMNVLHKTPDTSLTCSFTDMKKETTEMKNAAILACRLKIMGIDKSGQPNTKFNPNGNLTRAQLGTILSRLLRGAANDLDAVEYYKNHLAALKESGIMTKTDDPNQKEKRGNIMIMLQRAANK